jgi:hypothetical protein
MSDTAQTKYAEKEQEMNSAALQYQLKLALTSGGLSATAAEEFIRRAQAGRDEYGEPLFAVRDAKRPPLDNQSGRQFEPHTLRVEIELGVFHHAAHGIEGQFIFLSTGGEMRDGLLLPRPGAEWKVVKQHSYYNESELGIGRQPWPEQLLEDYLRSVVQGLREVLIGIEQGRFPVEPPIRSAVHQFPTFLVPSGGEIEFREQTSTVIPYRPPPQKDFWGRTIEAPQPASMPRSEWRVEVQARLPKKLIPEVCLFPPLVLEGARAAAVREWLGTTMEYKPEPYGMNATAWGRLRQRFSK